MSCCAVVPSAAASTGLHQPGSFRRVSSAQVRRCRLMNISLTSRVERACAFNSFNSLKVGCFQAIGFKYQPSLPYNAAQRRNGGGVSCASGVSAVAVGDKGITAGGSAAYRYSTRLRRDTETTAAAGATWWERSLRQVARSTTRWGRRQARPSYLESTAPPRC